MQAASVNERVEGIKGKAHEIDLFINEYKPFIASCVQKATGRFVRYGEDDELSIGLIAFSEAIQSYNKEKGNFLAFSGGVIKRRLIDYYRKEKKHSNVISINDYTTDQQDETDYSTEASIENYSKLEESEYRRLELVQLKEQLMEWDIRFSDLADTSPKHEKTRKLYNIIINTLISSPELLRHITQKKYLPIAQIEEHTKIPRKTIERARKYIIAAVIIRTGDYEYVNSYVNWG